MNHSPHKRVSSTFDLPGNMSQSPSSCSSLCAGTQVFSPGESHGIRSMTLHPHSIVGSHRPSYPFSVSHAAQIAGIEQGLALVPSEAVFSICLSSVMESILSRCAGLLSPLNSSLAFLTLFMSILPKSKEYRYSWPIFASMRLILEFDYFA